MGNPWIKRIGIGIGISTVLAVQAFVLNYKSYENVFFKGTYINGVDVSNQTPEYVADYFNNNTISSTITITGRGNLEETIRLSEIGGKVDYTKDVEEIFQRKSFMQFLDSLKGKSYKNFFGVQAAQCEEDLVKQEMSSLLESLDWYKSKNATIEYDKVSHKYVIKPEVYSNKFSINKASALVYNSVQAGVYNIDLEDCYSGSPKVTSDNKKLKKRLKELNSYLVKVTLVFGGRKEVLEEGTCSSWVLGKDKNGELEFDTQAMRACINEISHSYDTYGAVRKFRTSKGKKIKISGGSYGWLMNIGETVSAIQEVIASKRDTVMEPVYSYTAMHREEDDIGDTYVEVSLKDQHVWVYKNGKLKVDTDCVTGLNSVASRRTPMGIYPITFKKRNYTLVGEGYSSPVSYWIPFNKNVGLHDASWRSYFGGNIYKTNGSHGCVNLPTSVAKKIYKNVKKGEPVIVY